MLTLMGGTFSRFTARVKFFNSIFTERTKWEIGLKLGLIVLGQVLRGKYSVLSSMDRGKFIVTIDYECQAVATIFWFIWCCYSWCWLHWLILGLFCCCANSVNVKYCLFAIPHCVWVSYQKCERARSKKCLSKKIQNLSEVYVLENS